MTDLIGTETLDNVRGQDGTGAPAAITELKRLYSVAGAGGSFSSANANAQSSTTLTSIAGLVQTLTSGTYKFNAILPLNSGASGGVQFAFAYTGLTVTSVTALAKAFGTNTILATTFSSTTSQAPIIGETAALVGVEINGTLSVSQPTTGSLALQFAQNASNGTTTTVYQGAAMQFVKIGA
jgi:hypothetical protein